MQHGLWRFHRQSSLALVDRDRLDKIAKHLNTAYLDTVVYRREFLNEHGSPPSLMAKIHNMRSAVQAALARDDRYELRLPYAEYGRVQFAEITTGDEFLLRSSAAVRIEDSKFEQLELFPGPTTAVHLLVYSFEKEGVCLSITGTSRRQGRRRLEAAGPLIPLGVWPYLTHDDSSPFDQDETDAFDDLGDLGDLDEEGNDGVDA